ncbi:hypothetical protein [Pseudobacter ginsenosidimutans]|nr:hypothetical protein [Pseudobacter ginsenosidimutans]QEC44401.1 hypothetical protein FSB84_23000 [Pseudobacter ginsenosidimutans]
MDFLDRLRAKERVALQQFVDEYSGALYFLILFIVEDDKRSEKVLHYALKAAIAAIHTYDPQQEGLFLWLLKKAIPQIDIDRNVIVEKFKLLMQSFE